MGAIRLDKGMVHVITGDGAGKTTLALGKAMRAAGHGFKVYMIQFMKSGFWEKDEVGEVKLAKKLPNFKVAPFGRRTWHPLVKEGRPEWIGNWVSGKPAREEIEQAMKGLNHAREIVKSGEYDLVILDEINYALDYGLIPIFDVLELIKNKPRHVELFLTGRHAPTRLRAVADYVIEIPELKHPGCCRKGIEY